MHISEVMSKDVKIASPKQSIQDAARMMAEIDAGAIPVGEGDQLVGMITDRDIAVRAVAAGKPPNTPIADVMSHEVKYCYESDNVDAVSANMADIQLRRLPVLNQQKRVVGIVSLAVSRLAEGRMMPPPRYLVFPSLAANIHNRRGPASISSKSSIAGDRPTVSERC